MCDCLEYSIPPAAASAVAANTAAISALSGDLASAQALLAKTLTVRLAADISTNLLTTQPAAFNLPVVAGKTYKFRYDLVTQASATTTACQVTVTGPASPTRFACVLRECLGEFSESVRYSKGNYPGYTAQTTTPAANADTFCCIEGVITPSVSGNLSLLFYSTSAGTVAIKAGSIATLVEV